MNTNNPKNWHCVICHQSLWIEQVWTICHGANQMLNLEAMCESCCDAELVRQKAVRESESDRDADEKN